MRTSAWEKSGKARPPTSCLRRFPFHMFVNCSASVPLLLNFVDARILSIAHFIPLVSVYFQSIAKMSDLCYNCHQSMSSQMLETKRKSKLTLSSPFASRLPADSPRVLELRCPWTYLELLPSGCAQIAARLQGKPSQPIHILSRQRSLTDMQSSTSPSATTAKNG